MEDVNNYRFKLNAKKVSENLKDLIPLAEKWGIEDDVIRSEYLETVLAQEKKELKDVLDERVQEIKQWLDSFSDIEISRSDEWGAFNSMLLACEEIDLYH